MFNPTTEILRSINWFFISRKATWFLKTLLCYILYFSFLSDFKASLLLSGSIIFETNISLFLLFLFLAFFFFPCFFWLMLLCFVVYLVTLKGGDPEKIHSTSWGLDEVTLKRIWLCFWGHYQSKNPSFQVHSWRILGTLDPRMRWKSTGYCCPPFFTLCAQLRTKGDFPEVHKKWRCGRELLQVTLTLSV